MGTGITSVLLNRVPYNGAWLFWLSVIVYVLNVTLFAMAVMISVVRYAVWPRAWSIMLCDPQHSLFLAAIPISFATVIDMFIYVCIPYWGTWAPIFAWACWILDSILALVVTVLVPHTIMSRDENHDLSRINAVHLMPVASPLAAAITGGLIASVLENSRHAQWTIIACIALWWVGIMMSSVILTIYYLRLILRNLPAREAIPSVFLPTSPLSLGSIAAIELGSAALKVFPITGLLHEISGPVIYILGVMVGVILWTAGLLWLIYAIGIILHVKRVPFTMGWWGFTFPLGSWSLATIILGREFSTTFLMILSTISSACCFLLWVIVMLGTIRAFAHGRIQYNSCVSQWEERNGEELKKIKIPRVFFSWRRTQNDQ
ncbi:voltage-dependent anion channel [Aspergillus caelatus]|uniref:Voltage-dependent anion channel n=1 Tax=Aspergillus caelatus TaxID=61420 RepID=A0A5N7ADR3_9EURO|nr:voltage-dependent anion channel [Aspergillus caelatus]KAE8367478.1 voltage-dependent anion channel [Aspergillus caelatus]